MGKGLDIKASLTDATGNRWMMTAERRPEASYGRRFMVIFPEALRALYQDADAPGCAGRLLFWCFDNLSFEQWRTLRQVEVASAMGLAQTSISAGLRYLTERGLIEKRGAGPRQEWRVTTEGGWRGTAGQYQKARRAAADPAKPHLRVVGKPAHSVPAGAPLYPEPPTQEEIEAYIEQTIATLPPRSDIELDRAGRPID
jgi:DNA-binding transcriptional ArsR family regulator